MKTDIINNNLNIYARWRRKMLIVGIIFVFVIICTEIGYYFMYYKKDDTVVNGLNNTKYLFFFLLLPTLINSAIVTIGILLNSSKKLVEKAKNYIVSLTLICLCGFTISVHYVFPPLISAICIPIFLTTVFGEKKLTIYSVILAFFFIVLSYLKATNLYFIKEVSGYFKDDQNLTYNYIIGILCLICTYIGCRVIVYYQKEKADEIIQSYKKQIELYELLRLDSLTKLYNHSSIYEIIDENLEKYKEINQFSLAMIDIDNFKSVNDVYGHIHGDAVLASLASILKKYSNDGIICARYGGEEFAILFIDYSLEDAHHVIKLIRNDFLNSKYDFLEEGKQITFSCGLTNLSRKRITPSEFFRQADTAMYQAKAKGKNCIVYYKEDN